MLCFLEELEALNIPGAENEVIHERVNSVEERERGNIVFLATPFATRPDYVFNALFILLLVSTALIEADSM